MKTRYLVILLLLSTSGYAQKNGQTTLPVVTSAKFSWMSPEKKESKTVKTAQLFQGSGDHMEYLRMEACDVQSSKNSTSLRVPDDEEHLLFIKSGTLHISFRDSSWALGPGSIALLMPREKYAVQNMDADACRFYRMSYRSKLPANPERAVSSGGSFVRDWKKLRYRPHDRGGVRSYFDRGTAMSKRFEMHVTTLNPKLKSHAPHTHVAEEIILLLEDQGDAKGHARMLIGEELIDGQAGDLYYIGSNILHGIENTGDVAISYFAFQFE